MRLLKTIFLLALSANLDAQDIADSLLSQLKNASDDTNKVNLLRKIGVAQAHQNPKGAIGYWREAIQLARQLNYQSGLARCYSNLSTGYAYLALFDSAITYGDTAIFYGKLSGNSNQLALIYLNHADNHRNLERFKEALLYCDTALAYAEQAGSSDRLARIFDIISDIYAVQSNFSQSLTYLQKAMELYQKDGNAQMVGQVYSDYADIYRQQNQWQTAVMYYRKAIQVADSVQDLKNLSVYYADLGDVFIGQKQWVEAERMLLLALRYGQQQNNNIQLATAYQYLALLYNQRRQFADAVAAGAEAYRLASLENNLLWKKEACSQLATAYAGTGRYDRAFHYLSLEKTLNDSLTRQRFSKEVAALQSSLEVQEKDKEILLLSKNNELKEQQLSRQRLLAIGALALSGLAVLGIGLFISRYRLKKRVAEMQLRSQIAADLHDEVGSSLSSIHMLSQMATATPGPGQQDILQRVSSCSSETIDKMGDIVWMIKPSEAEAVSLQERMEQFLFDVSSSRYMQGMLAVEGLEYTKISMQQRRSLYLLFKEAVNNAAKYSGGDRLEAKLTVVGKKLSLTVQDNGKGFDTSVVLRGNGLQNMQQRAKELKGTLQVQSGPGLGTRVHLEMPV